VSDFPTLSLIEHVEALILQIFDVPREAAHRPALELAALAEGWGSPEAAQELDWSFRLKMDLGDKLEWRSAADQDRFRREREERRKVYELFIQKSKGA
jgi:hypothetical protein